MQQEEIKAIMISAVVLAAAFAIARGGGIFGGFRFNFVSLLVSSLIAVSLGFILHEMGHRYLAKKYGYYAEFKMWSRGLIMAVMFSFFGFVFAAPGAVVIHPRADLYGRFSPITKKKYGLVSLMGPVMNLVLVGIFFGLLFIFPTGFLADVFVTGMFVNIWLALFNMLPVFVLDGAKIFAWDRKIWGAVFALIIVLFGLSTLFAF
ncbi:site-2 protease family protein [Candidatus Aenigmatarchaeota archaeon]